MNVKSHFRQVALIDEAANDQSRGGAVPGEGQILDRQGGGFGRRHRVGLAPTGKRRLSTAHAGSRLMCCKRGSRDGQSFGGACCVEQEARVVTGIPLRQRMGAAERLLADANRSMKQWLGVVCMTGFIQQACEVAEVCCRARMLGAERLLVDSQRALNERPRGATLR
jgi:hypothetical protein